MKKLIIRAIILYVVITVTLIAINGCVGDSKMGDTEELGPAEIREYEGEKLSSVDDFRENSIKGPQQVDIESYQLKVNGLVENPRKYTYGEVIDSYQHYKKLVTLNCVEGWSVDIMLNSMVGRDDNYNFIKYLTTHKGEQKAILVDSAHLTKTPLDVSKTRLTGVWEILSTPYPLLGIVALIFVVVSRYTLRKGESND